MGGDAQEPTGPSDDAAAGAQGPGSTMPATALAPSQNGAPRAAAGLPPAALAAFQAPRFVLGAVPEVAPPVELCF
jgi:hypothetical protein